MSDLSKSFGKVWYSCIAKSLIFYIVLKTPDIIYIRYNEEFYMTENLETI